MATIKDVARRAGVSVSTVSRVLNASGYFDPQTARAVRRAIEELGYRPNVHWTRLKRNSSETIAFILGNRAAMNSMQMSLLMACEQILQEAGYDLVFACMRYSRDHKPGSLALPRIIARQGTVDGIILGGVHHDNFLDLLSELELPWVLVGNTFVGARSLRQDTIFYDDIAGAFEATEYLLRLGHRHIAFCGNTRLPWFARRYEGYATAMRKWELPLVALTADWQVSNIEYGQLATAQLLRQGQAVTAIFGGNDEVAAGAWKELTKRQVAIPGAISLIGFGDRKEFHILEPPLTTISVFQEELGRELARMLLAKLSAGNAGLPSKTLPCKLGERGSCGPPPNHKP